MSDVSPLSSLAAFSDWRSPRPWGPDGAWRVTFGSGRLVIDDLVAGLAAHRADVADRWPNKAQAYPVVVGCSPWLTNRAVVDALVTMSGCIVVDKRNRHLGAVHRLASSGRGLWQILLGMEDWGFRGADGSPPVISPFGPAPGDRGLEPVRLLGYATDRGPLMHAKLAVCCGAWHWEGDYGQEEDHLTPMSVWIGSANWTEMATQHIEFGAWTADEKLCASALEFMTSVIKASEPLGSAAPGPLPELVAADWDDAAFIEYLED